MGNMLSRCAQNMRKAWRSCSKKPIEEEAMLSTCDSEPLDKCQEPLFPPSVSEVNRAHSLSRTESQSSLVRLQEKIETVDCKLSSSPKSSFTFRSPHHHAKGYTTLVSTDYEEENGKDVRPRSFVDRESQTTFDPHYSATSAASPEPQILSKEYIVKTYSIQNATPTPSPATQTKFSPANHSVAAFTPTETTKEVQGPGSGGSGLASLERRQDDVLKGLEQLQATVTQLAQKYNVLASQTGSASSSGVRETNITATTVGGTQAQRTSSSGQRDKGVVVKDLVISVDPSSIPLSLVILCDRLSEQFKVLKSTFIHSSVCDSVPEKLRAFITSNGGIKRADSQLIVNFVWKKVSSGAELVVNPVKQTPIQGEANIVRYLSRLLNPSHDAETDVVTTTQIDELLDLAQLQILEGNNKEKAAAVRTLNSALGKRDWLVGSEPSIADIVCWSALQQTGQTSNPPANVKKWLSLCSQHKVFQNAAHLLS